MKPLFQKELNQFGLREHAKLQTTLKLSILLCFVQKAITFHSQIALEKIIIVEIVTMSGCKLLPSSVYSVQLVMIAMTLLAEINAALASKVSGSQENFPAQQIQDFT
jgi:hypothetical protein